MKLGLGIILIAGVGMVGCAGQERAVNSAGSVAASSSVPPQDLIMVAGSEDVTTAVEVAPETVPTTEPEPEPEPTPTTAPPATWPKATTTIPTPATTVYTRSPSSELASIRACESEGDYSANTGNGYYGAYQFDLPTWTAAGGSGYPHLASPSEQDMRAQMWINAGNRGAWPNC